MSPRPDLLTRTLGRLAATATAAALGLGLAGAPATADPTSRTAAAPAAPAPRDDDGIRERQLDRLLDAVHRRGAVGVTAELVTPDGTWRGAAGNAERDPRRPATEDARFRAASVTKQLVTVLALQQVERGRWRLDTTLGDVLPGVWPGQEDITLRQLLSHTSGLPEYLLPLLGTDPSTAAFQRVIGVRRSDGELVATARTLPTTARGEHSYANTNFVLVGMMLEEATGRSLGSLLRERVFEPAGMTQSSWPTTRRTTRPRLAEYGRLYGEVVSLASFHPSMFSGAGALISTARDLNRFQAALGRGELVPRRLVREMRTVVAPTSPGLGAAYGLGSYRLPDPCRPGRWVHGHDGGSWGTLTVSYAAPGGGRRVAVSMTGRDYDGRTTAAQAMLRLATTALAQTCGGEPRQDTLPGTTSSFTLTPSAAPLAAQPR